MADVTLVLKADNSGYINKIKEAQKESQKLHDTTEKGSKREKGLIEDLESAMQRLQEKRKRAFTVEDITKYNQKLQEAKRDLEEYEKAGLKAQKQSESFSKTMGDWALRIGGVTMGLNLLKQAFLATTAGVNAFNMVAAVTEKILYNLVTGAQSLSAGLFQVIAAQKVLNQLRYDEKIDLFNSTKQQILYNKYLVEAKDQTKSLTDRLLNYDKALEAHNTRINMEIETMQKRATVLKQLIDESPGSEKLKMEYADLQIAMLNAEVRRYAGQKEVSSMRSGLINAERKERLDAWYKEIEEQNRINQIRWDQEDKLQKEINTLIRENSEYRKKFSQDTWKDLVALEKSESELMGKVWELMGLEQKNLGLQHNKELHEDILKQAKVTEKYEADERERIKKHNEEKREALKAGLNELLRFTEQITNRQVEDAQRYRDILDTRISETQAALETEVRLYEAGYASNVAGKQLEVERLKQLRAKALKDEEEAMKKQRQLDTLMQVSGLITSSVDIFKSFAKIPVFGIPLAIAMIGTMFSAFAAVKLKASEVTKYAKGGWTGEGSHRDETGERMAGVVHEKEFVVRKGPASRFREVLEAINKDDKLAVYNSFNRLSPDLMGGTQVSNITVENNGPNNRLDRINNQLYQLNRVLSPKRQSSKTEIFQSGSSVIIRKGNSTKVINK